MRLFIAIKIPEDVKNYLINLQKDLIDCKLVKKENMHLTLKFLGDVNDEMLPTIKDSIKKIAFDKFTACTTQIGVFPNSNYIKVIWIGLKPEETIIKIKKELDSCLIELFKPDKDFKPHITLARVKFAKDNIINEFKKIKTEEHKFEINEIKLIKSILTKNGSEYEVINQ